MNQFNPEGGYVRNYLDWMLGLLGVGEQNNLNIKLAEKILDEDHYGLEKVKERITEYLAVHKLFGQDERTDSLLCRTSRVGKTSIGKSIARALSRKFIKVSLGGIRDEAEIEGIEELMSAHFRDELFRE